MFKIVMIVDDSFSHLTARMIVDDSLDGNELVHYHQLSFALNMFKIVMIVDDSFSHLTVRTIVDDSLDGNELVHYHRLSHTVWSGFSL